MTGDVTYMHTNLTSYSSTSKCSVISLALVRLYLTDKFKVIHPPAVLLQPHTADLYLHSKASQLLTSVHSFCTLFLGFSLSGILKSKSIAAVRLTEM